MAEDPGMDREQGQPAITRLILWLRDGWNAASLRRLRAVTLASVLLGGIALIEVGRRVPTLQESLGLPPVHLEAIQWTVSLFLVFEIIELIFSLPGSVATTVARHLQVFALVLLRDAFAKLSTFPEPIEVTLSDKHINALGVMGSDAAGAILLFAMAVLFGQLQKHRPITGDRGTRSAFIAIKSLVALLLLVVFGVLCGFEAVALPKPDVGFDLFDTFFTLLVFADVLLAIASLAFTEIPAVVFRNFGFALGAIFLRLAIASPEYVRPGLGLVGGLTAIAVTLVYNYASESPETETADEGSDGAGGEPADP